MKNCKDVERMIIPYLNGQISERKMQKFIDHVMECPSCYEEMEIGYMATIGLERLEKGASINIEEEMKRMLEQSRKQIRLHTQIHRVSVLVNVGAMLGVAYTLIYQISIWCGFHMPF